MKSSSLFVVRAVALDTDKPILHLPVACHLPDRLATIRTVGKLFAFLGRLRSPCESTLATRQMLQEAFLGRPARLGIVWVPTTQRTAVFAPAVALVRIALVLNHSLAHADLGGDLLASQMCRGGLDCERHRGRTLRESLLHSEGIRFVWSPW